MIHEERVKPLNRHSTQKGTCVLYWMQASQRTEYNHALEFAVEKANELNQPLIVYFGLTDAFPEANERHYHFMLEGLQHVRQALRSRGIGMCIERVSPDTGVLRYAKNASLVICDRGYLKIQKQWRKYVAEHLSCPLLQVESDVVVPLEAVSGKEEYSAATLRRKLLPMVHRYLVPLPEKTPRIDSTRLEFESYDISDVALVISGMDIDHTVKPVAGFRGSTEEAKERLDKFIGSKLDKYLDLRNDPNEDGVSHLSP